MRHFGNTGLPFSLGTHPFSFPRAPSLLSSFQLPQVTSAAASDCCRHLDSLSGQAQADKYLAYLPTYVTSSFSQSCCSCLQASPPPFPFPPPLLVWISIYTWFCTTMSWGTSCMVNATEPGTGPSVAWGSRVKPREWLAIFKQFLRQFFKLLFLIVQVPHREFISVPLLCLGL